MGERSCPYCDGDLRKMDKRENIMQCSNLAECPASFVGVIG